MPQKILIVDDDPDIREAMSLVLEGAGYEVVMWPGLQRKDCPRCNPIDPTSSFWT